jgi:xanthine dehydrogenase accessory factor
MTEGRAAADDGRRPGGLAETIIGIKGAGEMASAVAWRLFMANLRRVFMMEAARPLAVRREASFCEALVEGAQTVEGVAALRVDAPADIPRAWERGMIPVAVDPEWRLIAAIRPDVVVDAIIAKRNLGTHRGEAALVIGLGPGFTAGGDVHFVIETNRGHNLGRIITSGAAEPDTGIPGEIAGASAARVLRAPAAGAFASDHRIGAMVAPGEILGWVGGEPVVAAIGGVLRGLIRPGTFVPAGLKVGDIDPRGDIGNCGTISDKARAISGSVLEAVLRVFNR